MMGLGASRTDFLPDNKLQLRNSGAVALTSQFNSAALDLARLVGYWNTDELGVARTLEVVISVEAIVVAAGQSYTFYLEIDDNAAFSSVTRVAAQVIAGAVSQFDLALARETALLLDNTSKYLRLGMTPSGVAETGSIAFGAVADNADTVTINDGTHAPTVFTFGDGTGGTVDKGASATASAQNLKTAILALGAGVLNVGVSGAGATLTLTNLQANTGGSITKSDVDNDYVVTNFAGGGDPSIKFWAYIRGALARG